MILNYQSEVMFLEYVQFSIKITIVISIFTDEKSLLIVVILWVFTLVSYTQ